MTILLVDNFEKESLSKTDNIEAFYVSSGSVDFHIERLKKKTSATLRKVDFEFLKTEYKLLLF
ncbi:hypothetical protein AAG747_19145 [Rapidithrix thailandica]|uniref:HTH LytTR-type domain-containing protein n=1 Tax=Rapidithrix thailandica TaxID=413964 RepID=A0AAW9SC71_9BACT